MTRPDTAAEDRPHGEFRTYRSGCRCAECRRANADYYRARGYRMTHRARNYARRTFVAGRWIAPLPDDRHGTRDAYDRHGCRCISCTRANRECAARGRAS